MVKVFFTSQSLLENSSIANSMKSGMDVDAVSVFGNFSGSKINAFPSAVSYCRRMLLLGALEKSEVPFNIDADWERQLDVLFRTDKESRKAMKSYIQSVDEEALYTYLTGAFEGMLRNDGNGIGECGKCFVEIASISPSNLVGRLSGRAIELFKAIRSNNVATRFLAAHAFGMLAPHPAASGESIQKLIESLRADIKPWLSAVGADANRVHGSILALGHILSRASYYGRLESVDKAVIQENVSALFDILTGAKDVSTKEAVFNAIGQISASGVHTATKVDESSSKATGE
jgi:proteasome component ECM29